MKNINQVFAFNDISVFFKHTDTYGFVHPYNYFEWLSYAREAFFQRTVPHFHKILEDHIKMITVNIEMDLLSDARFGDRISIDLHTDKIRRCSFDMILRYRLYGKGTYLAKARHTIAFINANNNKLTAIPKAMMNVIVDYTECNK